jgi:WD40 repeat protein
MSPGSMMRKVGAVAKKWFLLCVSVLFFGACRPATVASLIATPTQVPKNAPTLLPVDTTLSSSTSTVDLMQQARLSEKCVKLTSSKPSDIETKGVVVLAQNNRDKILSILRGIFLLDMEASKLIDISRPNEVYSYYGMAVSPDRKMLAYGIADTDSTTVKLVLSNNKGELQKAILWENTYPLGISIAGWLNNQQLKLNPDTVFNPYTGEKENFSPSDFPGYLQIAGKFDWLGFDPSATRAIYKASEAKIVTVDIKTKQILAEIPNHIDRAPVVAWSSDGSRIAIVGTVSDREPKTPLDLVYNDEIFILDNDGKQIKQVTHLALIYSPETYNLYNLAWSPDSRYIAFWQMDAQTGVRLFVLDAKTQQVTSYCVWSQPDDNIYYGPIWSPDGNQLLIENRNADNALRAVVVDLKKSEAFVIAEDKIPVGWMTKDP